MVVFYEDLKLKFKVRRSRLLTNSSEAVPPYLQPSSTLIYVNISSGFISTLHHGSFPYLHFTSHRAPFLENNVCKE
jgi:hypothetical protein